MEGAAGRMATASQRLQLLYSTRLSELLQLFQGSWGESRQEGVRHQVLGPMLGPTLRPNT
jgi:hypothetical protein